MEELLLAGERVWEVGVGGVANIVHIGQRQTAVQNLRYLLRKNCTSMCVCVRALRNNSRKA